MFKLINGRYQAEDMSKEEYWFEEIELGLKSVFGKYQGVNRLWLRWCDADGNLIPTSTERAEQEKQRAEQEKQRAEQEKQRAEQQEQRAEQEKQRAEQAELEITRLQELLRQAGITTNGGLSS
ncbi:MAG: hypothetical protein ACKO2V_00715 [Snowella sp.]